MATFITPVQLSPTLDGAWNDVDVNAHISASATGVMLEIINASASTLYDIYIRKNGSTDENAQSLHRDRHYWESVGVDGSQIFEVKATSGATLEYWLYGYFEDEASFFTNGIDVTPSMDDTWEDQDISSDTGGDTAIAAIVTRKDSTSGSNGIMGLRKNGSTDGPPSGASRALTGIIGCDGSEIYESYESNTTNFTHIVVGYITSNATFNTNSIDVSLVSSGMYIDFSALPSGSNGAIYRADVTTTPYSWNIRKNGSSIDHYREPSYGRNSYAFIECDGSLLIEGKVENILLDFYEVGYFDDSVPVDANRIFIIG